MKLTAGLLQFPDERLSVQTLDLNLFGLRRHVRGRLLILHHQVINLSNVLLKLV
jgi:hypothetical protein